MLTETLFCACWKVWFFVDGSCTAKHSRTKQLWKTINWRNYKVQKRSKITVSLPYFESADFDDADYFSALASEERDEVVKLHFLPPCSSCWRRRFPNTYKLDSYVKIHLVFADSLLCRKNCIICKRQSV